MPLYELELHYDDILCLLSTLEVSILVPVEGALPRRTLSFTHL